MSNSSLHPSDPEYWASGVAYQYVEREFHVQVWVFVLLFTISFVLYIVLIVSLLCHNTKISPSSDDRKSKSMKTSKRDNSQENSGQKGAEKSDGNESGLTPQVVWEETPKNEIKSGSDSCHNRARASPRSNRNFKEKFRQRFHNIKGFALLLLFLACVCRIAWVMDQRDGAGYPIGVIYSKATRACLNKIPQYFGIVSGMCLVLACREIFLSSKSFRRLALSATLAKIMIFSIPSLLFISLPISILFVLRMIPLWIDFVNNILLSYLWLYISIKGIHYHKKLVNAIGDTKSNTNITKLLKQIGISSRMSTICGILFIGSSIWNAFDNDSAMKMITYWYFIHFSECIVFYTLLFAMW